MSNGEGFGGTGWAMTEFSWDAKYAGIQILASKVCCTHVRMHANISVHLTLASSPFSRLVHELSKDKNGDIGLIIT